MTLKELATKLRTYIEMAADSLSDTDALDAIELYPEWKPNTAYFDGTGEHHASRVRRDRKLWKCIIGHTSQESWAPESTPALWVEVALPGEYREIKENMLPTEAFDLDEIGWWQTKDNLYRSKLYGNTYTPASYPFGWEKI